MSLCGICQAPATVGSMCAGCLARAELRIMDTPELLRDLDVTITKQARQAAPGPGGGSDRMVLNLPASETGAELRAAYRAFAGKHDPTVRETLDGLHATARHPDTPARVTRLEDAFKAADRARDSAPERRVIGTCPCGRPLATTRTTGTIECRRCGQRWDIAGTLEDRTQRVQHWEVSPAEAETYVWAAYRERLPAETVRTWIKRGTLTRVWPDAERVLLGDVIRVWEEKTDRVTHRDAA
ncbi:hypothetical protein [Kocuria sp.]|uniref:hypothetical protein n=1 Tax=Kocuria sp. TaxID=1871328 RepID=UPI0026DAF49D|nr:hypothetical protein [Kocuria sp.]MDO4919930.1 hypothetical protein [Kocuria sp.]